MNATTNINNYDIEQSIEKYKGMIICLARRYGLHEKMDFDDILQEGYITIWHALNTYDTGKASLETYIWLMLERRIYNLKKYYNTKKKAAYTVSIDNPINFNNDITLMHVLQDPSTNSSLENLYFIDQVKDILNNCKLTKIEKDVFINVVYYRELLGYSRICSLIKKNCGLKPKTIDNALTRIKKKVPLDELKKGESE